MSGYTSFVFHATVQLVCPEDEGMTLGLWSILTNGLAVNTTLTSLGLSFCAVGPGEAAPMCSCSIDCTPSSSLFNSW